MSDGIQGRFYGIRIETDSIDVSKGMDNVRPFELVSPGGDQRKPDPSGSNKLKWYVLGF